MPDNGVLGPAVCNITRKTAKIKLIINHKTRIGKIYY